MLCNISQNAMGQLGRGVPCQVQPGGYPGQGGYPGWGVPCQVQLEGVPWPGGHPARSSQGKGTLPGPAGGVTCLGGTLAGGVTWWGGGGTLARGYPGQGVPWRGGTLPGPAGGGNLPGGYPGRGGNLVGEGYPGQGVP